ncbi:MAG: hypothetical protein DRR19_28435 [Candidatus Parabeggiatoa sp. nov. 1]|nr:MAG: hypothetical protein DRR19_28435 [Gammaproteobacteria bacterium]
MAHLSPEQLMPIPDEQLRGRIGRLMTLKVMFGMLNDFTHEQMNIFDESLVRGSFLTTEERLLDTNLIFRNSIHLNTKLRDQ